jgi:ubiquinone/menaquinone biosynthesis C-methylase UbiE
MQLDLSESSRDAWKNFLNNRDNSGHAERNLIGQSIDTHVAACLRSATEMTQRLKKDLWDLKPAVILEIGSSTGLNCIALQKMFPESVVYGIEPEEEAVSVAVKMTSAMDSKTPVFFKGVGEDIPLADGSVDLIVCHTVIEHVIDVHQVICEFSRLLSPKGVDHLDAPNYLWPYEPHLQIWTIPLFGKSFVAMTAKLQGKGEKTDFLNHLQFVTPFQLEKSFRECNLNWENRVVQKFFNLSEDAASIKQYKMAATFIGLLHKIKLGRAVVTFLTFTGIYPSVMYTLRK